MLEVRDFKKRAKEGRSHFLKARTLQQCSVLHTVQMKIPCASGPRKPHNLAWPGVARQLWPPVCHNALQNTQITCSSSSVWRRRRIWFIDQMGCYVRPFGLEEGAWFSPGWQLRWGSLSGPGRRAPDSCILPIWRHRHPPVALHWPSALLLTPPCLHNRTNHLLITSHIS